MDKKVLIPEVTHRAAKMAAVRAGITLSDYVDRAVLAALQNGHKAPGARPHGQTARTGL